MKRYKLKITFTESLLGTVAKNKKLYTEFILEKGAKDELETVPEIEEIGTGFHMLDGKPILYNYVIKGFFKDACSMLRRDPSTRSSKLKAYKKVIDGLIFIDPRQIPIVLNGEGLGINERPLRGQTAQGERIALAKSDMAPVGTRLEVEIKDFHDDEKLLKEWLDYGALRGLGQWRNAGWGTFEYELTAL